MGGRLQLSKIIGWFGKLFDIVKAAPPPKKKKSDHTALTDLKTKTKTIIHIIPLLIIGLESPFVLTLYNS